MVHTGTHTSTHTQAHTHTHHTHAHAHTPHPSSHLFRAGFFFFSEPFRFGMAAGDAFPLLTAEITPTVHNIVQTTYNIVLTMLSVKSRLLLSFPFLSPSLFSRSSLYARPVCLCRTVDTCAPFMATFIVSAQKAAATLSSVHSLPPTLFSLLLFALSLSPSPLSHPPLFLSTTARHVAGPRCDEGGRAPARAEGARP